MMEIIKLTKSMYDLFVLRTDCYARQWLNIHANKKSFSCIRELLTEELIKKHLLFEDYIASYNLNKNNECIFGCYDFDTNTKEDFEKAKNIYKNLIEKGFHPMMEKSGGGEYKVHIFIFSKIPIQAKVMIDFLKQISKESKIEAHEIFPKQEKIDKDGFGNFVKLPLGKHLETNKISTLLDNDFNEISNDEEIYNKIKYHLDNKDEIPELKIKELTLDEFFKYVLEHTLPKGVTNSTTIGNREAGINNNILKNEAIWLHEKGYDIEKLKKEIKPIYDRNGWVFGDLAGWFRKAENGSLKEISVGEIVEWCKLYLPEIRIVIENIPVEFKDVLYDIEKEIFELTPDLLRRKLADILTKILIVDNELLQEYLIGLISFRVKIKKEKLEKEIIRIKELLSIEDPICIFDLLQESLIPTLYFQKPNIPKGSIIMYAGKSGKFKSMLVLANILSILNNSSFLSTFETQRIPKGVLYYDLENGKEVFRERLEYLIRGMNIDVEKLRNFHVEFNFNKHNLVNEMKQASNYDIIILDSYRRFLDGEENNSSITDKFFREYLKPLKESGKTIIIIHHLKKNKEDFDDEDIIDMFRGSTDIPAQLDIAYRVSTSNETIDINSNNNSFIVNVAKAKNRLGLPIREFSFNVTKDDDNKKTIFEFNDFKIIKKKIKTTYDETKERNKEEILRFLVGKDEVKAEDIKDYVIAELNVEEVTVYKYLRELLSEFVIEQPKYGYYKLKS